MWQDIVHPNLCGSRSRPDLGNIRTSCRDTTRHSDKLDFGTLPTHHDQTCSRYWQSSFDEFLGKRRIKCWPISKPKTITNNTKYLDPIMWQSTPCCFLFEVFTFGLKYYIADVWVSIYWCFRSFKLYAHSLVFGRHFYNTFTIHPWHFLAIFYKMDA